MTTIVPSDETSTPFVSSLFTVEFGELASGRFNSVSGLSFDIEEVSSTQRTAEGKTVTQFSPGTVKYAALTLKRDFTGNKEFWDWHDKMCKGEGLYQDGSVVIHDLGGKEVDRWNISKAWPSKWSASDLSAGSDDVLTEEIELQIEFMERAK